MLIGIIYTSAELFSVNLCTRQEENYMQFAIRLMDGSHDKPICFYM
jgi:flagellar basal body-associated protein FliL